MTDESKLPPKDDEIIVKRGNEEVKIGLVDYKAFLSFALLGATAYLAYIGNDAWRELALMTGMAIAWWFRRY